MIQAFRLNGKVVLEVKSSSPFEAALLLSASQHGIGLVKQPELRTGFSRYKLAKPEEGKFNEHLRVVFRRWPSRRSEGRVRAELRKMTGYEFFCKDAERQVNLDAPYDAAARVRCGLHAGTHGWECPSCSRA